MALFIGLNTPKLRILQRCVLKEHGLVRKLVVCSPLDFAVVDLAGPEMRLRREANEMWQE